MQPADPSTPVPHDQFQLDHVPKQVIQVPTTIEGNQILLVHTEAVYFLRKIILEAAQKLWPDVLTGVQASSILHHTQVRSELLVNNFESELIANSGFNTGMEYST